MNEKIHWADVVAAQVPEDRIHHIATGITPSGPIHIGNMREVLTGDLVYKAIRNRGLDAELLYFADDFDPLRKVYPFLPEHFSEYVGKPISDIPCPCGECGSYAEHYLTPFLNALKELDISPRVMYSSREYRGGSYTEEIRRALQSAGTIRAILERVSGRSLPEEWSPFYPICKACGTISRAKILEHEESSHRVRYRCACGGEDWADYSQGEGKLVWRVDWPMRWAHFGITVEPFGKDHASAGGSYDTGKEIVTMVYHSPPPFPVVYEWISLKGRGEMHSSKGVVITINEMLDIVPPEVLRYLIVRTRPEKTIDFDPGMGLISLIDEYDRVAASGVGREYELSRISTIPTRIPFRHMVTVVQIAHDENGIFRCLARSGYNVSDHDNILKQAERVTFWLRRYAPPSVKFSVQEELPKVAQDLTREQRIALQEYARVLENLTRWSAEELHNTVYEVAEQQNVPAKDVFVAMYLAFLGQQRGPRLGWFLEALGKEFVMMRLGEAVRSAPR